MEIPVLCQLGQEVCSSKLCIGKFEAVQVKDNGEPDKRSAASNGILLQSCQAAAAVDDVHLQQHLPVKFGTQVGHEHLPMRSIATGAPSRQCPRKPPLSHHGAKQCSSTECISSASVQPCRADPSPREEISKASTDQIGTRGWTNPPLELQARAELLPRWAAAPAEGAEGHRKLHRSVDRHEHRRDQASGRNI
eukprot:CAMPEP_0115061934 /NCGR_PEP_ID=MMETSP0227-20121206/8276_1 /TAXON_ID=89957 /ORGANISM="Polarella glacialis, Strain CCMP 1383" /LENGTH=192 /DNA_ID=CAMNT_0002447277 /DNA_START=252 /DNA_END=831 /DNA_ORIENTATION=-